MRPITNSVVSLLSVIISLMVADTRIRAGDEAEIGHEAARQLVESGRIRSLDAVAGHVIQRVPGKLIETKLEREDGDIVYELKILRPDGRVQEVEVDAETGTIVKIEDDD